MFQQSYINNKIFGFKVRCMSVDAGSPFKFYVTDINRVTAKGSGLSSVVCRQPASFTISTPSATSSSAVLKQNDLDVSITGQYPLYILFL